MSTARAAFRIAAILVTSVTVFFASSFLIAFLMFDVFEVSNDQADLGDLVLELIPFVIPPTAAVFAGLLVARRLRPKPQEERGFVVIPKQRENDRSGSPDAGSD